MRWIESHTNAHFAIKFAVAGRNVMLLCVAKKYRREVNPFFRAFQLQEISDWSFVQDYQANFTFAMEFGAVFFIPEQWCEAKAAKDGRCHPAIGKIYF